MAKAQRKSLSQAAAGKGKSHNPRAEKIMKQAASLEEPKKQLHVFLPASLHTQFKLKAVGEGRSMNEIIEDLIASYLEE